MELENRLPTNCSYTYNGKVWKSLNKSINDWPSYFHSKQRKDQIIENHGESMIDCLIVVLTAQEDKHGVKETMPAFSRSSMMLTGSTRSLLLDYRSLLIQIAFFDPCFFVVEQYWLSATHGELICRHAVYSFSLFLYQKSEFRQMIADSRVKEYLLQGFGSRFVKK